METYVSSLMKLARGSKDLVPFRATAGAANTARGLLLARHLPCGQDPTARVIRAGFLEWVQVLHSAHGLIEPDIVCSASFLK